MRREDGITNRDHSREPAPVASDWVGRALHARISTLTAVAVVGVGLAVSWVATYLLGGAGHVAPHWFYVPILIAATRLGVPGAVATAAVSGLLAGPLMPLDVALETAQDLSDWTSRAGFFLGNGLIMVAVIGRLRTALGREVEVAQQERDLTRHKETVIQTVSHEFRTPLTVMRGTVDTLAQRDLVAGDARPLVASLDRAIRRLDGLMRVLLATSQALIDRHSFGVDEVDLHDLCLRAAGPDRTARIRFTAEGDAQIVTGDPELLGVLIGAIVDNALKFSPPATLVEVASRRTGSVVEVRVSDSGPGISDAYGDQAFEAFTQQDPSATRPAEGLGVGLFAARKILDLLGGTITLARRGDTGTEATITIPQRRADDVRTIRRRRIRVPA